MLEDLLQPARRLVVIILGGFLAIGLELALLGSLASLRPYATDQDAMTGGYYLFSTIAQTLGSIMAIYIAVFFMLAQFTTKANFLRVLTQLYSGRTPLLLLLLYVSTIGYSLVGLACLPYIVSHRYHTAFDVELVLATASLLFLIPAVIAQIENLNPVHLARKFAYNFDASAVKTYGLAEVSCASGADVRLSYSLHRWGHRHGLLDPLGGIHELIIDAVRDRDRIRCLAIVHVLVERVSLLCGAPLIRRIGTARPFLRATLGERLSGLFAAPIRPLCTADRIRVTLHAHHYIVRRAHRFTQEWPNYDILRQGVLVALGDLLLALASAKNNNYPLRLSLFAFRHVSLGYHAVERVGDYEPIMELATVIKQLTARGYAEEAVLAGQILRELKSRLGLGSGYRPAESVEAASPTIGADTEQVAATFKGVLWDPREDVWAHLEATYPNLGLRRLDPNEGYCRGGRQSADGGDRWVDQ